MSREPTVVAKEFKLHTPLHICISCTTIKRVVRTPLFLFLFDYAELVDLYQSPVRIAILQSSSNRIQFTCKELASIYYITVATKLNYSLVAS